MLKVSRIKFIVSSLVLLLILGTMVFKSFSQEVNRWSNLKFATHKNALKFFDPRTGKIYEYSESGKLNQIWVLEKLGKSLKTVYLEN